MNNHNYGKSVDDLFSAIWKFADFKLDENDHWCVDLPI